MSNSPNKWTGSINEPTGLDQMNALSYYTKHGLLSKSHKELYKERLIKERHKRLFRRACAAPRMAIHHNKQLSKPGEATFYVVLVYRLVNS